MTTVDHPGGSPPTGATMRAVQFDTFGGPEVLQVRRVPIPRPGPGEVLARVHASGVNPKDVMFRQKKPAPWGRTQFPRGTGFDFAGEVVECGAGVVDLNAGQPVWGFLDGTNGGTAAEYLTIPRDWLAPRPAALPACEVAALPLVASAALQALRDVAAVQPGAHVLIRGAAGGVGLAAIQIAKVLGAEVTAVAVGRGAESCRAAGADAVTAEGEVLNSRRAFDVFIDCAGATRISGYARRLRRGGRWITVAPNIPVFALAPFSVVTRPFGLPSFGFLMVRPRSADLESITRWVDEGRLKPPAVTLFSLEQVAQAHEEMTRRGKVARPVLAVSDEVLTAGQAGISST